MARTENEIKRDDTMLNLLENIFTSLNEIRFVLILFTLILFFFTIYYSIIY